MRRVPNPRLLLSLAATALLLVRIPRSNRPNRLPRNHPAPPPLTERRSPRTTARAVSRSRKLPRRTASPKLSPRFEARFYQGDTNGKWDGNTVAALQKFQSANNLDASGKLDAGSLQKLGLGSSTAGLESPDASKALVPVRQLNRFAGENAKRRAGELRLQLRNTSTSIGLAFD